MNTQVRALIVVACLAATPTFASLVGTTVNGQLYFDGLTPNYFDPANGGVPAGYLNTAGPTVIISSTEPTFGYKDAANTDVANFQSGTQLVISDSVTETGDNAPIELIFTDTAFGSLSVVSDTFGYGGWSGSLVGDVITLNWAGGEVTDGQSFTAVYNVGTVAVPDGGSTLALLGMAMTSLALLRRKLA